MSWIDRIELYFLHHIILQNVSRSARVATVHPEVTSPVPGWLCFTILKMWLPKLIGCCLTPATGRKSKEKCRSELWARIKTVKYHCCSHTIIWKVSTRPHLPAKDAGGMKPIHVPREKNKTDSVEMLVVSSTRMKKGIDTVLIDVFAASICQRQQEAEVNTSEMENNWQSKCSFLLPRSGEPMLLLSAYISFHSLFLLVTTGSSIQSKFWRGCPTT